MTRHATRALVFILASIATTSCSGVIEDPAFSGGGGVPGGPEATTDSPPGRAGIGPAANLAVRSTVRRLSVREYNNVIATLIGDTSRPFTFTDDARTPFDNDTTTAAQLPTTTLIDSAEATATRAAMHLLADKAALATLMKSVGCAPKSATDLDEACFKQFLTRFGRRALRRPLTPDEIKSYGGLFNIAQEDNDFYAAVGTAVRMFLQLPELLYRMEADTTRPVPGQPGVFQLNGYEMASRLSFLFWSEGPDDRLLDLAQGRGLDTAQGVRDAVTMMLADPRARKTLSLLHAMWLGYDKSASPDMKKQTDTLVTKVLIDDQQPWKNLLLSDKTYVNYNLATRTKIAIPGTSKLSARSAGFEWLTWGDNRTGLLSEGSYLGSTQAIDEEVLVVRRGQSIRERLFCLPPLVKPANVAVPPTVPTSPCKYDVFEAATSAGGCHACHGQLNPVGYGLDAYDGTGAPRKYDTVDDFIAKAFPNRKVGDTLTQCSKSAHKGELGGKSFSGPGELAALVVESPELSSCVTQQIYRFAIGRSTMDSGDQQAIANLKDQVESRGFLEMLKSLAASDGFRSRRQVD